MRILVVTFRSCGTGDCCGIRSIEWDSKKFLETIRSYLEDVIPYEEATAKLTSIILVVI